MVIVAILGLLDILAALLITNPGAFAELAFALGIFHLIKGLASLAGSIIMGPSPFWIWMDITDLLTGLALLLVWQIPLLWLPLAAKGGWSLLTGW